MIEAGGDSKRKAAVHGGTGPGGRTRRPSALACATAVVLLCGALPALAGGVKPRIAAGSAHTLALRDDGTLWSCGGNSSGQLGDGTTDARNTPVRVAGLEKVVAVAAGDNYSLAVTEDGTLWAWGANSYGQLGDGTKTSRSLPAPVAGGFVAVSAGVYHSLALKADGSLWAWGRNSYGQLGIGTSADQVQPTRVGAGFTAIAAGGNHSLALTADGSLWAWGLNAFGQLGDGSTVNRAVPVGILGRFAQIEAGGNHSLALTPDGALLAWGDNSYGQLGDGSNTARSLPVPVMGDYATISAGPSHSLAAAKDGTVWAWGNNAHSQLGDGTATGRNRPVRLLEAVHVTAVAAGVSHSVALRDDGRLYAWGSNYNGQLGNGIQVQRSLPLSVGPGYRFVAAGGNHSVAVKADGTLWAWGDNSLGQVNGGGVPVRPSPVQVGADFAAVSAGYAHSFALAADGSVRAWGDNSNGQLGDRTKVSRPSPVPIGAGFTAVQGGAHHSIGLKADRTLWGWGANYAGQLGDGSSGRTEPSQIGTAVGTGFTSFAAGDRYTLALAENGTIWGWGMNSSGQLGDGGNTNRSAPVQVTGLTNVIALAAGSSHSLALKADGTVWGWGANANGQLGEGTGLNKSLPVPVRNLSQVVALAAGEAYSFALDADGVLWAWGANHSGQLGDGTTATRYSPVRVGEGFSAMAAGSAHTLALGRDGTLWAWGRNAEGQLGDGTAAKAVSPVLVPDFTLDTLPPEGRAEPPGGKYLLAQVVTLSADEPALVYYTVDGARPSAASAVYTGPLSIVPPATLQFFGEDVAGHRSPVQVEVYSTGYSLGVNVLGNGVVHSSPGADIDCGPDALCSADYGDASIQLTASPRLGSGFAGWTGCESTSGLQCTVALTEDRTVSATFVPDPVAGGSADPPEVVGACAGPGNGAVVFRHGSSAGGDVFAWSFGDGTPDWRGTDRNASVAHVYERPGDYAARLTVADTRTGAVAVQTLAVRAIRGPNAAPNVTPGGPYVLRAGQSLSLEGAVTDANLPCGDGVEVRWFIPSDGAEPVAKTAAAVIPWSALSGRVLVNGTTPVRFSAADGSGAVGSADTTLTVYDDTTRTTVSSSSDETTYGQPVTFTATVVAADPRVSPAGAVQFQVDDTDFGAAATLVGAKATLTTSSLPAGVHAVAARYGGDGTSRASVGSLPGGQPVRKAPATIALGGLAPTYDGAPKPVTPATTPPGLPVAVTYEGMAGAPTDAGVYAVAARVVDENHEGSATGTLVVAKAAATLSLGALRQEWDGAAKPVSVTTAPASLDGLSVTYDGATAPPTDAGRYFVRASLSHRNYAAEPAEATLTVVGLPFEGFFRPVDNPPVLNATKGGSAVPVKFSLKGDRGLQVVASGYPRSAGVDCQTTAPIEVLTETASAGASTLSYEPETDRYTYVWKTDRYWSGCRQLILKLVDGTVHTAHFQFGR